MEDKPSQGAKGSNLVKDHRSKFDLKSHQTSQ